MKRRINRVKYKMSCCLAPRGASGLKQMKLERRCRVTRSATHMIIPQHFQDLKVLHDNTEPNRSYYIPASKPLADPVMERAASDRMQLLSGIWQFKLYECPDEVEDFITGDLPAGFAPMPVPSCWQTQGYDAHQYTNVRYPFPVDPPHVPAANPSGAYRTDFVYHKDALASRAFLVFEV